MNGQRREKIQIGAMIVFGFTISNVFPVTPDAYQPAFGGVSDAFLVRAN